MHIVVDGNKLPIRAGLVAAIDDAWQRLARPGTWWTGAERIAIAAEVRAARSCAYCRQRKAAVSPMAVSGRHDTASDLMPEVIDAAHRLTTDAARLTGTWVRKLSSARFSEAHYVELISIVTIVTGLDTFDRALGRPLRALPVPLPGQPSRMRPTGTKRDVAWVETLMPGEIGAGELDPFAVHGDKNIHRGLSLVPQEVMNFFDLDVELYLHDDEIRDFSQEYRAISHAQIELIAARASAINECYY